MNTLAFNDLRHLRSNGMTDKEFVEWARDKAEKNTRFVCRVKDHSEPFLGLVYVHKETSVRFTSAILKIGFPEIGSRNLYGLFEELDQLYEIVEQSVV